MTDGITPRRNFQIFNTNGKKDATLIIVKSVTNTHQSSLRNYN